MWHHMPMIEQPKCVECGAEMPGSHIRRMYCSRRCKGRWQRKHPKPPVHSHECRICGKTFEIGPDQHNKWLCSDGCRRASNAKSVREFHERRPQQQEIYRVRRKAKKLPDGNLIRFYRTNPHAPRACESCGENRVLDVAHKPGLERRGEWRSSRNCRWPEMVWILCPTCHALLDRMNYPTSDLDLH